MTIDEARRNLLDDLFETIDELNTDKFLHFLTRDAVFRFGSAPPVRGHEEIRDFVNEFFSSIAGCRHRLTSVIAEDSTLACEGEVTYTRPDESEITLPFANFFEFEGDLVSNYKIYADASPLYASE
jgi:ketosteroid isomerase-like protein